MFRLMVVVLMWGLGDVENNLKALLLMDSKKEFNLQQSCPLLIKTYVTSLITRFGHCVIIHAGLSK